MSSLCNKKNRVGCTRRMSTERTFILYLLNIGDWEKRNFRCMEKVHMDPNVICLAYCVIINRTSSSVWDYPLEACGGLELISKRCMGRMQTMKN